MVTTGDILQSYLRLLQRVSGAEAVSLYLPAASQAAGRPRLVHGDGGPAVPELADAEGTTDFLCAAGARFAGPRPVPSGAPGA